MKTKLWLSLAGAAFVLLTPDNVEATGACTAARFHDWQSGGCNQNYAGAGGVPSGQSGAGGNQAGCTNCTGMPRWWVQEPYENLWIADTPLSYTMSSGQAMSFQWYYHQRYQIPAPDEVPDFYTSGLGVSGHAQSDLYFSLTRTCGMTNAAWSHNWMQDIIFWDSQWEYKVVNGQTAGQVFSDGYEALVFCPQGDIQYFYTTNNNSQFSLLDSKSQVRLSALSALGHPTVNTPVADTNGFYWGGSQTNGFQMTYPDGSKDIFGLCYYPIGLVDVSGGAAYSGAHAFLTQRIDPQGRVTQLGYEYFYNTNYFGDATTYGYRLRFVVDPDGRTNTFQYATNFSAFFNYTAPNPWELKEVDDPYGRKVQFGYDFDSGILTNITDAAGNTSSFQYQAPIVTNSYNVYGSCTGGVCPTNIVGLGTNSAGWITNLATPYGNTSFSFYQVPDPTVTDGFQQRAVYASEPTGVQQLYFYLHNGSAIPLNGGSSSLPSSETSPSIFGQSFDNGSSGTVEQTLYHRNTFHWGRRQFEALSSGVASVIATNLSLAVSNLTLADYNKADLKHWLLSSIDLVSITESMSSEQDPSPDAAGSISGLRTWYAYVNQPSGEPEQLGTDPQVTCIARTLPDGTSQYSTYNYYTGFPSSVALVSDNESSYSLPNGTVAELTNRFGYATNGIDLITVSNSLGQYVKLGYNGHHEVTSVTNALNQGTTLSWDSDSFNLTGIELPSGKTIGLSYYAPTTPPTSTSSLLQRISIEPESRFFTNNNYSAALPSSITDDRGLTVTDTWDGLNRLTGVSFPDGTTVSNIYSRLDLTATKDRLTNWTYYAFDGLDHLTQITNANNAVTTYGWCGCGSLTEIIDALSNQTTLNYDNQGNLTNVLFPDSSTLTYQYDLARRMTNAADGAGRSLQISYNNQDLPTSITGASGTVRSVIYDAVNRPISITDANGVTVTNTFDAINELLTRTWPDGISEGLGYSAAGLIAYTNRDNEVTQYVRDAAGRITAVTNANLEVVQLGFDSLDHMTNLLDGLNHTNSWQYNQFGWLTNKVDALSRNAFQYTYNVDGWVINRLTPEKGNTGYTYDNVGNLKSIIYSNLTITFSYDPLNRLTNMADAVGTTTFGYTTIGQLASETGPWVNDAVNYTYTQQLRTALGLAQPTNSWSQTYGYDSAWRMTDLVSPAGTFTYILGGTTSASPLIKELLLPNDANITNTYDSLARLTKTALNNYWGHTLDGATYENDPLGLRTNITRNFGLTNSSVSVGYDLINQLTSWSAEEPSGTARLNEQLSFGYDAAHNLHTRTNGALTQTFSVDPANELTSVARTGALTLSGATPAPATNITVNGQPAQIYSDLTFASTNNTLANGTNTFTIVAQNIYGDATTNTLTANLPTNVVLSYDNNGNLTNDGSRTFAYDAENQLTNILVPGQWRSDFVWDGLNRRRIARDYSWNGTGWVETNEVRYVYDGNLAIQERDTNNNVLVTYTRGIDLSGGLQRAGGIGGLLARTDGNGSVFYHRDGAGNITALIDNKQNIVARYEYDAFGRLIGKWGAMADANHYRFSSKEYDTVTGLYYYGFRYYDPTLQRWINRDPIGENGGVNLYSFVKNNSLRLVDPLGLYEDEGAGVHVSRNSQGQSIILSGGQAFNYVEQAQFNYEQTGDERYLHQIPDNLPFFVTPGLVDFDIAHAGDGLNGLELLGMYLARSLDKSICKCAAAATAPAALPTRNAAFRQAKRANNIPMCQQPSKVGPNYDRRGNLQPGKNYQFETPEGVKNIRDDAGGHTYPDDPSQNIGPHFNDDAGVHYEYTMPEEME